MTTENERKVLIFLYENKEGDNDTDTVVAATGLARETVVRCLGSLKERGLIAGPDSLLEMATNYLAKIDPNFSPTDTGYSEHIVLLASAIEGANEEKLATELGFDLEFVNTVGSRLRASGVWHGDELVDPTRWDEHPAFFLDGAVATGDLVITGKDKKGDFLYQMTPGGRAHVGKMLGRGS